MKHAGPHTLNQLSTLLAQLRQLPGLVERRPGIFYCKSAAYLHFHDDPAGVFADVKLGGQGFERFAVNTPEEQAEFLARVARQRQA